MLLGHLEDGMVTLSIPESQQVRHEGDFIQPKKINAARLPEKTAEL
ncbi:unnamed protein product [Acanthoscelides obtectus]|uniref:Uncharacterized protein n=1 Tax=Acanthoscelides obtectus TaxID=200917 RepID=A0A9P0KP56_ACAOB|nr:unnamed protein product [Acanthoscelides obtectus]CAK1622123.1 hypothetical protein AOBTE_LOCUS1323 [Acanthoscelides obtectus]